MSKLGAIYTIFSLHPLIQYLWKHYEPENQIKIIDKMLELKMCKLKWAGKKSHLMSFENEKPAQLSLLNLG